MSRAGKSVLSKFKKLLSNRIKLDQIILFGSRARRDAGRYSDMDVVVIVAGRVTERIENYISDCAWEAGFPYGIVIVPIVFSKNEWENGPERSSLLALAVKNEGIIL